MTQSELEKQVADITGEEVSEIRRLGFGTLLPNDFQERNQPLVVDWDLLATTRN